MIFYVSKSGSDRMDGSQAHPFLTINHAAQLAMPGDTVIIGGGIYRERVDPKNGGTGNNQRITYRAAVGETPIITGAEVVTGWIRRGDFWEASVDNTVFGSYNPYTDPIYGDWFDGFGRVHHTGQVYLNGQALLEAASPEQLRAGALQWYAQVDETTTTFLCSFGGADPNEALTEFNVRPCCFFPSREGQNYITVSGLTLRQAATQWAPPTAFQPGLIGPHWSKGWIIENCTISESRCAGISLGKRMDIQDNLWSRDHRKGGAQTYTEIVFTNLHDGWNKERIGGHIIRNNEIYNCGQAGIVGNMGCAFSDVVNNHIHHINDRREFGGAEMSAIKFHCGIDVRIEGNCIHHSTNGLWLDWEAQGARVRRNAFFDNNEDLFIEVCHGPCLVENNLFLSQRSFLNVSQGIACAHNLFAGEVQLLRDTNRFTMYHIPHSTMVGGVMFIYGGDDKIYNNIFLGSGPLHGTASYDGYNENQGEKGMENDTPMADVNRTLPVFLGNNLYLNGARPCVYEDNPRTAPVFRATLAVTQADGHWYLETNLYQCGVDMAADSVSTETLGIAFQSGQPYEDRDGNPITLDTDFTGASRADHPTIGPLESPATRILLF
ncbi:MAG: right-handed parallel beta-helix repeat-containing protein [Faecousia sp.]